MPAGIDTPLEGQAGPESAAGLLGTAEKLRIAGDYPAALWCARRASATAAKASDTTRHADALRLEALLSARMQDHDTAVRQGREALELLRAMGAEGGEVETLTALASAYCGLGMPQDALDAGMQAVDGATRLGNSRLLCWATMRVAEALADLERFDESMHAFEGALELARADATVDEPYATLFNRAVVHTAWARALARGGDAAAARAETERSLADHRAALGIARRRGSGAKQCMSLATMVSAQLELGDLAGAQASIGQFHAVARRESVTWLDAHVQRAEAEVLLHRGQTARAVEQLERTVRDHPEVADAPSSSLLELLCRGYEALGESEKARTVRERQRDNEQARAQRRAAARATTR